MQKISNLSLIFFCFIAVPVLAQERHYSENDRALFLKGTSIAAPRENIYQLEEVEWKNYVAAGLRHGQIYPVEVSGLFLPYDALKRGLQAQENFYGSIFKKIFGRILPFTDFPSLYNWMSLGYYSDQGRAGLERPHRLPREMRVGASLVQTEWGASLSFSCLTCHASQFFGTTVVGLPNKWPKANELFVLAKKVFPLVPGNLFQAATRAVPMEEDLFRRTQEHLHRVRPLEPLSLGLDTSLAQVGRALSTRKKGAWAEPSKYFETFPRRSSFKNNRSDSKPMPWWNVKYKNRWLADGSVLSGNPVVTNILWNEIGRGTDLKELNSWLQQNYRAVEELTAQVFSNQAPSYFSYADISRFDLESAKRGEVIFKQNCSSCHGQYEKNWSLNDSSAVLEQVKTHKVIYHQQTPIINVGTDEGRLLGMQELEAPLNSLEISRQFGIQVQSQTGYVPPPLVGIFARYPYLHNASVANLCELLTPQAERVSEFFAGPAENWNTDFDNECVGYPTAHMIPQKWRDTAEWRVDLRVQGRQAIGHDQMLFDKKGRAKFSSRNKKDLINFLKTL